MSKRSTTVMLDLVLVAVFLVVTLAFAHDFDLFERLAAFTERYERAQIYEVFTVLIAASFAFAIFYFRRWRESVREVAERERAEENLRGRERETLNDRLRRQADDGAGAVGAPYEGSLAAGTLYPIAGLIDRLEMWVLEEFCHQVREWRERYPERDHLGLCLNLSSRQIGQPDLAGKVARVPRETGLEPEHLTLETSERVVMEDAEYTSGKLEKLKDLNVGLALDDFGTKYCSLAYLERFRLDILEIDRLFVNREEEDPEGAAIRATLDTARSPGLTVIAEGVETLAQSEQLAGTGCDVAQGLYFARPLKREDLESLLVEKTCLSGGRPG